MMMIMSGSLNSHFERFRLEPCEFEAGSHLFRRDDPVCWLHRVEEGRVHLVRYGEDGGISVLQRAEPGSFLAEASLFSEHYHCDAVAAVSSRVSRFDRRQIVDALRTSPAFAADWAQYLSFEVHQMRARAEILSQRTVAARLDTWLALKGEGLPEKGHWASLAADIGVSPEALYRLLATRRPSPGRRT